VQGGKVHTMLLYQSLFDVQVYSAPCKTEGMSKMMRHKREAGYSVLTSLCPGCAWMVGMPYWW
jgi:hypothetical protein